ncbi:MAG: trypsin-like peptidase domain-containing protein [Propionivibrio sp.]|nr:trypsin-like peptidase domain-containing protein [Propionivibrio sp.]
MRSEIFNRRAGFSGFFFVVLLSLPGLACAALPELIEQIKPSIVVVATYAKTRSPVYAIRGAGFVVGNGNLIATNAHVIPNSLNSEIDETLMVIVPTSRQGPQQRAAKIVVTDPAHDLALLRIEGTPLPAMVLHSGGPIREGQSVAFTGFPIGNVLGLSPVTHRGIVSAITQVAIPSATAHQLNSKVIKRLKSGSFEVYQLDGTAYPGNSGGPLYEMEKGEVIGIINMVFVKGTKESALTHPSGISFAIPVRYLQELIGDLQ